MVRFPAVAYHFVVAPEAPAEEESVAVTVVAPESEDDVDDDT